METLDNARMKNPDDISFMPTVLRYGFIGGLISVVLGLGANMTGMSSPKNGFMPMMLIGLLAIAISITVMVLAVRTHREEDLGGAITFKRAFLVGFVTALIMSAIGLVFNLLYMNVIDPAFAANMMSEMEDMFTDMGLDDAMIDEQITAMEAQFSVAGQVKQSLLWGTIMSAVISLITAAIMKKEPAPFV